MQFTLTYSGELKANAKPAQKHHIRKTFHSQLLTLWGQQPLADNKRWFENLNDKTINLNRKVGDFRFVPLVSPDLHLICELNIFMLRPEPPGAIITQAGDIDNRLKTLFDALRIPKNEKELPKESKPSMDENPFFCLLEDDILISSVSVKTDRLLIPGKKPADVQLVIQVTTHLTRMMAGNRLVGGFTLV